MQYGADVVVLSLSQHRPSTLVLDFGKYAMDILILKTCCGQGYKSSLKLKTYLDSKGFDTLVKGKKHERFAKELKEYGLLFNGEAILLVRELKLCLLESQVDDYIKRDLYGRT